MQFTRQTNSETMERLAKQIEERMHGDWSMIWEDDLERIWPMNEEDREEKIRGELLPASIFEKNNQSP